MNNKVLFGSNDMTWATPQAFFDKLNDEFSFSLDPCCCVETAKCKKFYTEKEDGLKQSWQGETVFCNPPYGGHTKLWVKKAAEESCGDCTVVMLLPCRPDVSWFHDYILNKAEVRLIRGRLKFGNSKNSAPFPSMVVIFRKNQDAPAENQGAKPVQRLTAAMVPCHKCKWSKGNEDYCSMCRWSLRDYFEARHQ